MELHITYDNVPYQNGFRRHKNHASGTAGPLDVCHEPQATYSLVRDPCGLTRPFRMSTFYIDEAGYTGYDLLNKQQQFQGAAALQIDENMAKLLVEEHFPNNKAVELKHRSLSRRKNNWEPLLNVQQTILRDFTSVTYVCDKQYLLTLMFLNSCVEPFFHDLGIDFHENGQHYGLASLLHYTAPSFWGAKNFKEILYLFQRAQRTKSDVAVQALIEKAKSLLGRELSENLMPLAMEHESCIKELKHPKTSTDAALVVLFALVSQIEKYVTRPYEVVHDTSENLNRYNQLLSKLCAEDSHTSFKQTEITSLNFPLKLSGVSQRDSRNSYGVQLADLLVGGMIEHCMTLTGAVQKTDYNQAVVGLYGDDNLIFLLPDLDFQGDKDFRKGSQSRELIDFFADKFS